MNRIDLVSLRKTKENVLNPKNTCNLAVFFINVEVFLHILAVYMHSSCPLKTLFMYYS